MKTLALFSLLIGIIAVRADDEKFPILKVGSDTYTNVVITSVTASDINFIHAAGAANARISDLSPELQKHFHYNAKQAAAAEQKLASDNAKYHEQLLQHPAVKPPDMTRAPVASAPGGEALWRTDYPGALQQAKSDPKLVLLDFTGSDWCGWCIKFQRDVLSTPKFGAYANKNLELVKVDFPRHSTQSEELKHSNTALGKQFNVDGLPTFVLVNGDGKELGRQVGYLEGGPDAFISKLEGFGR
jgi:thiol-disulfide isomerase/thioredoxin